MDPGIGLALLVCPPDRRVSESARVPALFIISRESPTSPLPRAQPRPRTGSRPPGDPARDSARNGVQHEHIASSV